MSGAWGWNQNIETRTLPIFQAPWEVQDKYKKAWFETISQTFTYLNESLKMQCVTMMRLLPHSCRPRLQCKGSMYLWQWLCAIDKSSTGFIVNLHTVNSYARIWGWHGHALFSTTTLTILYEAMRQLFNWKLTDVSAIGRMMESLVQNLAQNINSKYSHVWAEISKQGATQVCVLEGIMAALLYCEILRRTRLPFIHQKFPPPSTYRFMQDNDPKHTSSAQDFYARSGINWWCVLWLNHLI